MYYPKIIQIKIKSNSNRLALHNLSNHLVNNVSDVQSK